MDSNASIATPEQLDTNGRTRRACLIYAAAAAGLTLTSHAIAKPLMSGPVQFVVPFSPGSASDLVARVFAAALTPALGQSVVVTNRPGAGGTIAAGSVAKATPDGRMLAVVGMGHMANPALYKSLPYDTLNDFAAISPLGTFPNLLVVPPGRAVDVRPAAGGSRKGQSRQVQLWHRWDWERRPYQYADADRHDWDRRRSHSVQGGRRDRH